MNLDSDIDRLNDPGRIWASDTVYRHDLLAGRVVLISGAGSGIGRACALLFARLGARLVICGRTPEKLEAVAEFVRSKNGEVLVVATNIREPDQVDALFEQAQARYGRIDCIVNNAGGQFAQPGIDIDPKGWNAVINNNLNGTWLMMQRAGQYWRDQRDASDTMLRSICNVVVVIERGMPGIAHTVAARAGIIGATRTVAVEWAPLGIRVNCIAPGLIATEGLRVYPPEAQKEFPIANPMMRPGTPMEIAESCVYVSAQSGSFITGEVITVDGGGKLWGELWTAGRPEWYRN